MGWRRRGRSRPGCRKAAAEPASLPHRPHYRGLPQRLLHFPSSLSTSSLPFSAGLFSQAPPPRLPRRRDTTGQQRVVLLGAPKFSLPQPAPPCSLSPGASLSLGCAKRPLMVRFSCRTVLRPCKVLAPQTHRVGSWHNSLWRMSAKAEPRRILNSESLRRDMKPSGSQGPV